MGNCCSGDTTQINEKETNYKVCMLDLQNMTNILLNAANARQDTEIQDLDGSSIKTKNINTTLDNKQCVLNIWERNVSSPLGNNMQALFRFYYENVSFIVIVIKMGDSRAIDKLKNISKEITIVNNHFSQSDQLPVFIIAKTSIRETVLVNTNELESYAADKEWYIGWANHEDDVEENLRQFAIETFEKGIKPKSNAIAKVGSNNQSREAILSRFSQDSAQRKSFFDDNEDDVNLEFMKRKNKDLMGLYGI